MKFEFKLLSGKQIKKEPLQYPNPFELLKTNEKQKEIVSSVPVLTDAFGRTLYQTPNGQFRAIGDIFNLVANVYQAQNDFVTLAPPPEDDEEDTMPKQKPKRKAGGIIIMPPPVVQPFEICFVIDQIKGERVYRLRLGEKIEDAVLEEIFNCPSDFEPYDWWTSSYLAFGFFENTVFILGYDINWDNRFYRVGYEHNLINSVKIDSKISNSFRPTYYSEHVYFAYFDRAGHIKIKELLVDLNIIDIDEISYSGTTYSRNYIHMWNKFIVYRENFTIKIYDYINKKLITQITTETSISPNISIVQDNKTHACFLLNYFGIAPQHFIILKEDGTYKDIIAHGDNGWIDATEDDAYIAYNKDKNPSPPRVILSEEWENEFIINSYDDYNLWSKVPVSELYDSSNFNNILRVKLITNIGVPVHWIGRVSEDKYLIRSWNKLYHLDKNLFNLEFIYDVSDLIHSSGSFTISIVPEKDGTVFICERYGYTNTYYCIYRSLDSGKSWTKVLDNIPEINISNGLICCGNGIIYFIAAYAMHTRCSIDNGSTWQSFSYGEAKGRGFPVYLLFPDDPESDLYDWVTNYGHCGYVSGKNIVYMRYTGESSSGTKISYDHGLSFSEWGNPPPWKTINKIVATKNGTILFASIIDEEGDYDLFRSESEGEWVSCGIPFVPLGLYEVAEGFVLITNNTQYLSNDKGVNWEQVDLIGFNRVFIDIYSIKNSIPVLKKRKEWIDHSLSQSQKIIGSGSLGKLYNNIFYFDGSAYNINANTIQINSGLEYSYDNLCLKKYLIYTTSDPKGGHVLFLKDLETSQKLILMQTEELGNGNAHFYPIHLATYFT